MATLTEIKDEISLVLDDPVTYTEPILNAKINDAVKTIAGGIRMPDGQISYPLPELMSSDTIATTTNAYADLPSDYQRNVFYVADNSNYRIPPPAGGDYYSFVLFLNHATKKDLSTTGSVTSVCVKGKKLYYQGIPSSSIDLLVYYYATPTTMVNATDEPEGIPSHLQKRLIKHYVCKELFGEAIEDGEDNQGVGYKYHTTKFYEAMVDLMDYVGQDAEPVYYAKTSGSGLSEIYD